MRTVGVDIFVHSKTLPVETFPVLEEKVEGFSLKGISNRGTRVWPGERPNILCVDIYRCRFDKNNWSSITQEEIVSLLAHLNKLGLEWVHIEKLHEINGQRAFSAMQGE